MTLNALVQHKVKDVLYKTRHSKDLEYVWIYTHTCLICQQGDIQLDSKQAIQKHTTLWK